MPDQSKQFRVLYRDFLYRLVDLEVLSSTGDIGKLLMQFTSMLAAFSLTFAMFTVSKYVGSNVPHARMALQARTEEEFLMAATMAIAGLFSVLAWNTVLPTRRDCLVLGILPVRLRTIFGAKIAALATALAICVTAVNIITGLYTPFIAAPEGAGFFGVARTFAAYWLALFGSGALVCGGLLALQGLTAQFLTYRLFLRVSGFLQLASFFAILGIFFLKPPFPNPMFDAWLPSFWFFGLFQTLNGNPAFSALAARAGISLAVVLGLAVITFSMAYGRSVRKIVEQPDIAPADRSRSASRWGTWLARRLFVRPIDRAIVLFTARGMARSRQHRLLLAAYMGIGLAIALAYGREYIYGPQNFDEIRLHAPWNQPNVPFLAGSLVLLFFALIGARAIFAMPIALPANWIFRITAVHSRAAYFRATRKALFTLAGLPIWIAAALLFFTIWPVTAALEHLAMMGVLAVLLIAKSMRWFRKIPFACSYLPGKANLHIRLGAYGAGFLFVADKGVELEFWSMHQAIRFAVLVGILLAAALWARKNTLQVTNAPAAPLQFEDRERPDVDVLDLRRDGTWSKEDAYIDRDGGGPGASGGSGLGNAGLIGLGISGGGTETVEPPVSTRVRLEQAFADLRHGLRVLVKAPAFSAAAIALVAMGIGGNATIYSLIHGVLSRPAPGVRGDGLVSLGASLNGNLEEPGLTPEEFIEFATSTRTMSSLMATSGARFAMDTRDGGRYQMRGQAITPNYFSTLGVPMALGRTFTQEEMLGQSPLAAILAYHVWENQFGKAPDVLGQIIQLNGSTAIIVGVSGRGFYGFGLAPNFEVGIPLTAGGANRFRRSLLAIGRLAPGMSMEAAQAELDTISQRLADLYPEVDRGRRTILAPYTATVFGPNSRRQARIFMAILMTISILTLVVVCANVANLMLARAVTRQREMAVRLSMGASRARILRILFAEGLAISLIAAGAALLFAQWATTVLISWLPPIDSGAKFHANLTPDWRVAFFAVLLAVGGTIAFTLVPAIQTWRQDVLPWLKAGEQCVIQGRSRIASVLVVVQIALCFVLLAGAAVMRQSASLLNGGDLYFVKDHLLLVSVDTSTAVSGPAQNAVLLERLRQRLRAVPGVTAASHAANAPPHAAPGLRVLAGGTTVSADANYVGPGYLETLGVPILAGTGISAERPPTSPAAVINQKLAQTLWPGQSALGRQIQVEDIPAQVIGVVPDGEFSGIGAGGAIQGLSKEDRGNFVFLGGLVSRPGDRRFHVRFRGSLSAIAAGVRNAVREVDPRLPIYSMRTLESEWDEFTSPLRFISALLSVFATGSLLLAGVGLYAVAAFYTARRTREFGIRLALGASPGRMQQGVLGEAAILAGVGVAVGAALSVGAKIALSKLLVGFALPDAGAWITASALLSLTSMAAAFVPARRAARTDPMAALRME